MCDYSLYSIPNRLAQEGEDLVLHKFGTGSLGFVAAGDLIECEAAEEKNSSSFWGAMKDWLLLPRNTAQIPAIYVPPGAQLLLDEIPASVQRSLCIQPCEVAVFIELHAQSYSYRDALLLPNATRVLLQDLPEGIHAIVLSTSSGHSREDESIAAAVA
jgi:hypothetical protein